MSGGTKNLRNHTCIHSFPNCCDRPNKKHLREEGFTLVHARRPRPSQWGKHGGTNSCQLRWQETARDCLSTSPPEKWGLAINLKMWQAGLTSSRWVPPVSPKVPDHPPKSPTSLGMSVQEHEPMGDVFQANYSVTQSLVGCMQAFTKRSKGAILKPETSVWPEHNFICTRNSTWSLQSGRRKAGAMGTLSWAGFETTIWHW